MTVSSRALSGVLAAAMLCSEAARAGVWGADPTVGISGDYGSNPALIEVPHPSETDAALLFDAPLSYQGNSLTLSLLPSFRVSDTSSYASVNSDYVHLSASGEFDTERNTFKVSAGANRDSSLYQNFLVDGEAAVRRDGLSGDLAWTRHLTERLDADLDVDTVHVRYGTSAGNATLVSYKDTSVVTDLAWQGTERDKTTLAVNAGQYDSLAGTTRSRNYGAQLAYSRSLTEAWSLTVSGGYSRQQNRLDLEVPELVYIPGYGFTIIGVPVSVESQVDSPVYAARLTRTGPRLTLNLSATRQEAPTGFAFLSLQTAYDLQLSYALTQRCSASLHEYWLRAHDPSLQGGYADRVVNAVTADLSYQLSEHYTLDLALSRIDETLNAVGLHLVNNQVTLTLNYKFNHIGFQ